MDVVQRELLLRHRDALVADVLYPEKLLPSLVAHNVLTHEDCNIIHAQATSQARMRQLLDLLPERGESAFAQLCNALQNDYSWLSDLLNSQAEAVASQSQHDEPDFKEELFFDARLRGGVPLPPANFVFRQEVQNVREKLKMLKHPQCLVLHGMTGSGKSCLAAAALDSKELVLGTFKGIVIWLSLGDGVLPAQLALLHKLERHWPLPTQHQSTSHVPPPRTEDLARDALVARVLQQPDLKRGLLVLDDVAGKTATRAFNIGLRMLILTQDLSTMEPINSLCDVIEMVSGFSEEESLQLLASSVDMSSADLCFHAHEIHRKAWGFPLVISLIGGLLAQFKEDARQSEDRWQEYSEMLSRKHRSITRGKDAEEDMHIICPVLMQSRRNSLSKPGLTEAITQSLDTLSPTLKKQYFQLVVFDDDVNILPEVLATLWGLSKYEVEENMCILIRKSLASRRWNEELRCYVYGVHFLLLHYLQGTLTPEEIRDCHAYFVHQYETLVGGDWGLLPKDNYAHLFLAKHMSQANLALTLLPNLLLNLSFVATRLRLNVPEDLRRDFQRLRDVLDDEDLPLKELLIELQDYENFLERWGDLLRKHTFLNIVQCALQEPPSSQVHRAALRLANSDQHHNPYCIVSRVQNGGVNNLPQSNENILELPGVFSAACLCCQNVLLASQDGSIILVDPDMDRTLHTFYSLSSPCIAMEISADHSGFAAASTSGEVLFWTLPREACICPSRDLATPPPRLRQLSWQPVHGDRNDESPLKLETGVVASERCGLSMSSDGDILVWHTEELLKVWQINEGSASNLWEQDKLSGVKTVAFGLNDSVLFIAAGDIYLCAARTGTILQSLAAADPHFIHPIKEETAATGGWCWELNNEALTFWEWWSKSLAASWSPNKMTVNLGHPPYPSLTSAAVSPDQTLIVVVTSDAQLLVLQQSTREILSRVFIPASHELVSLSQSSVSQLRALLKTSNGAFCIVNISLGHKPPSLVTVPSAPVWSTSQQWAANLNSVGKLRVIHQDETIKVQEISDVTTTASDGQNLYFGTSSGQITSIALSESSKSAALTRAQLDTMVTHISHSEGWVIASSLTGKLWAWCPNGERWCEGLNAPILTCSIVSNQMVLMVCTIKGLQLWDLAKPREGNICDAINDISGHNHKVVTCAIQSSHPEPIIACAIKHHGVHQIEVSRLQLQPTPHLETLMQVTLPGEATVLALSPGGSRLVALIPSQQLLMLWNAMGRLEATVVHSSVASITQIEISNDTIITAGSVLAWWKLTRIDTRAGTICLKHVLEMAEQCGKVKFCTSPGRSELLVSDAGGSLWVVSPLSGANVDNAAGR